MAEPRRGQPGIEQGGPECRTTRRTRAAPDRRQVPIRHPATRTTPRSGAGTSQSNAPGGPLGPPVRSNRQPLPGDACGVQRALPGEVDLEPGDKPISDQRQIAERPVDRVPTPNDLAVLVEEHDDLVV